MAFQKPGHYNAADRDKIPEGDFAGPNKSFPIVTPQDVEDAAGLHGHSDNPEETKRRIIAIAKRKGKEFVAKLPAEWKNGSMNMREGFNGQWVEIFKTGTHHDDKGVKRIIDSAFLDQVIANFDAEEHEPPAVIGHPQTDSPAYGYVAGLRRNGEKLEAQFADTDTDFESLVRDRKFPKRSAAFYVDPDSAPANKAPALRHVGFLGAQPPAVKGLKNIHFSEGESFTIEFSEGETPVTQEKNEKPISEQIADYFRGLFSKKDETATASFSEADAKTLIEGAVRPLTEKITSLETENKTLREAVDSQTGSSQRAAIVAFCESLPGTILPALRKMGIVEFMEALEAIPQKKKITVITFAEEAGKEVEKKVEISPLDFFQNFLKALPPFIQFGERFGDVKLKGDGSDITNPEQVKKMLVAMGVTGKEQRAESKG